MISLCGVSGTRSRIWPFQIVIIFCNRVLGGSSRSYRFCDGGLLFPIEEWVSQFLWEHLRSWAVWLVQGRVRSWLFQHLFISILRVRTILWSRWAFFIFLVELLCYRWGWRSLVGVWVLVCNNLLLVRAIFILVFLRLWWSICAGCCWKSGELLSRGGGCWGWPSLHLCVLILPASCLEDLKPFPIHLQY